jgi:aminopeptidase N
MEQDKYLVKVWQDQDLDLYPVYKLPIMLDMWENGKKIPYMIEVDKPYQEFEFDEIEHPELVIIDSDYVLVGEIAHRKTPEQYLFQYTNYDDNVRARIDALEYFMDFPSDSISKIVISDALNDPFWVIREQALQVFEKDTTEYFASNEERIVEIALADPHTLVKAGAIAVLAAKERLKYIEIFKSNLYDSSYSVAGQALYAYLQSGTEDVEDVLRDFSKETNFNITSSVADYYIQKQDHTQYAWFSDKLDRYSSGDLWYFIKLFGMYLLTAPEDQVKNGVIELEFIASNHNQFYNRLSAYQSLELLSDVEGVSEIIEQIKANEKDSRIRAYFDQ